MSRRFVGVARPNPGTTTIRTLSTARLRTGGSTVTAATQHAPHHTTVEHTHGDGCGHVSFPHGGHVDYAHDGHVHRSHGDHFDECAPASHVECGGHHHTHGESCGHVAVPHDDHVDYLHDGHRHASHADHWDDH
jgi:hypothetical protein